jgi:hypothetical protein
LFLFAALVLHFYFYLPFLCFVVLIGHFIWFHYLFFPYISIMFFLNSGPRVCNIQLQQPKTTISYSVINFWFFLIFFLLLIHVSYPYYLFVSETFLQGRPTGKNYLHVCLLEKVLYFSKKLSQVQNSRLIGCFSLSKI